MAKSSWNRQLGLLNCIMVAREKGIVYCNIFDQAVDAVVSCDNDMTDVIAVFLLSIVVTIVILLVIVSMFYLDRQDIIRCRSSHLADTNEVSPDNVENRV